MPRVLSLSLLLALGGCAPESGGHQQIAVAGVITEVAAADGGRTYVLDASPEGVLPLDLADLDVPSSSSGVVVEVPVTLDVPHDQHGMFAALAQYVDDTGESLLVVGFVP